MNPKLTLSEIALVCEALKMAASRLESYAHARQGANWGKHERKAERMRDLRYRLSGYEARHLLAAGRPE